MVNNAVTASQVVSGSWILILVVKGTDRTFAFKADLKSVIVSHLNNHLVITTKSDKLITWRPLYAGETLLVADESPVSFSIEVPNDHLVSLDTTLITPGELGWSETAEYFELKVNPLTESK